MDPLEVVCHYALSFAKTPYIWGGESPDGYDCSGFVQEILRAAGEDPPGDQTAQGLYNHFSKDGRIMSYPFAGCLIFYGSDYKSISHVAFSLNSYQIIEAGGGNSSTNSKDKAYKKRAFVRVRTVKHRSDVIAIIRPHYNKLGLL